MLEYTETIDELRVARNLREIFRDGENVSEKVQNDIIDSVVTHILWSRATPFTHQTFRSISCAFCLEVAVFKRVSKPSRKACTRATC